MSKDMDLSHVDLTLQEKIYTIIRYHWSVFDEKEKGMFVPLKNTNASSTPDPHGKRETQYMCKCIVVLAKVGHIWQIMDGS